MPNTIMHARDAISASLAECFVTIEDHRYNFMQAINLEANFEKTDKILEYFILNHTLEGLDVTRL